METLQTARELGLILENSLPLLPVLGTAIRGFGGLGFYELINEVSNATSAR